MNVHADVLEARRPPHSIEAEQAVLGAILMNADVFWNLEALRAEHFFEDVHSRIFEAIEQMIQQKQTPNPITLKPYFEDDPALTEVGGAGYLAKLATSAVNAFNINELVNLIIEMHSRRALIGLGEALVNESFEADIDVKATDLIERVESGLTRIVSGTEDDQDLDSSAMVSDYQQFYEQALNPDTNALISVHRMERLCETHNVFADGNLVAVAGRPGMGKTAFAVSCMRGAARHGHACSFFSMEMQASQITARLMGDIGYDRLLPIPYKAYLKPLAMTDRERRIMEKTHEKLKGYPLFLNTRAGLTFDQIYAHVRKQSRLLEMRGARLRMVVIDYLQLMRHPNSRLKRYEQIGEDIRAMKTMAKELNICVVALSQLNRGVEQREDKRPTLADLAESGAIEQAADIILFPFREAYYLERTEPASTSDEWSVWNEKMERARKGIELIIAKNKNGETRTHNLFCDITTNTFMDL